LEYKNTLVVILCSASFNSLFYANSFKLFGSCTEITLLMFPDSLTSLFPGVKWWL